MRTQKIILEDIKRRVKRIRNNILYKENQSVLFKENDTTYEGETAQMETVRDFGMKFGKLKPKHH